MDESVLGALSEACSRELDELGYVRTTGDFDSVVFDGLRREVVEICGESRPSSCCATWQANSPASPASLAR